MLTHSWRRCAPRPDALRGGRSVRLRARAADVRWSLLGLVTALVACTLAVSVRTSALTLDRDGDLKLGMRAYTAVRIGTQELSNLSYPPSEPGHVRQHRYFLDLEWEHDLTKLVETSNGPVALLRYLPFPVEHFSYDLKYRGEGEGIYDYGPKEYSTVDDFKRFVPDLPTSPLNLQPPRSDVIAFARRVRSRIRRIGRQRHRFFQGYFQFDSGPVFVRIGRQNLSWGETDVFRLLDNINPLDDSFGSFFIPLDERRRPLDMARMNVNLPDWGPFSQAYAEMFGAFGNRVGFSPGVPQGSPWTPGGLNFPNLQLLTTREAPDLGDLRGGGRVVFNARDITFSLAHYWTYLDIPAVSLRIPAGLPSFTNPIIAKQTAPRVPISGASMTFALPQFYSVVRSEFAYFHGEPAHCQGTGTADQAIQAPGNPDPTVQRNLRRLRRNLDGCLDPFRYPGFILLSEPLQGRRAQRDSINYSVGFDINRYIRWLNPHQTFFITTQVFYKHIVDAFDDQILPVPARSLPLRLETSPFTPLGLNGRKLEPSFAKVNQNQILHTLLVTTSYRGGTIVPSFGAFYDWHGVWLFQPGVQFVRDPFRLLVDYTGISGVIGGQIGLLRDRDNLRVQLEYVF
jgi:hypothetical protein